ncbi:MAG: toll/interleukin-1 receptor domain-containing protein [Desulfobacteraceae bacterium]|nr:toll/interleukin-1 receptor domain-containing protein [Desulfobacteraceae bacterium]
MASEKKVFISYAEEDYDTAKKLYNDLEHPDAIKPWLDNFDILPGQNRETEIKKAIKTSDYFLALFSKNSVSKRGFVQKEQKIALEILDKSPSGEIFFIPVRIEECKPADDNLQKIQYVDIFPSYEKGLDRLLHVLSLGENKSKALANNLSVTDNNPLPDQNVRNQIQQKLFISYSHQDEKWKDRLMKQLKVLEMEGYYGLWEDRQIEVGDDWLPEIENALNEACMAVMMISADFLISNFIRTKEIPRILERRKEEGLRVFPIIVKPCPWTKVQWLSSIQVRPKDGKPLASGSEYEIEAELADIAEKISEYVKNAKQSPQKAPSNPYPQSLPKTAPSQAGNIDKRALRGAITKVFDRDDLEILCSDIEEDLSNDGVVLEVNLDAVGGGSKKENKVLSLINYLDKRGYLNYLITAVKRSDINI